MTFPPFFPALRPDDRRLFPRCRRRMRPASFSHLPVARVRCVFPLFSRAGDRRPLLFFLIRLLTDTTGLLQMRYAFPLFFFFFPPPLSALPPVSSPFPPLSKGKAGIPLFVRMPRPFPLFFSREARRSHLLFFFSQRTAGAVPSSDSQPTVEQSGPFFFFFLFLPPTATPKLAPSFPPPPFNSKAGRAMTPTTEYGGTGMLPFSLFFPSSSPEKAPRVTETVFLSFFFWKHMQWPGG